MNLNQIIYSALIIKVISYILPYVISGILGFLLCRYTANKVIGGIRKENEKLKQQFSSEIKKNNSALAKEIIHELRKSEIEN